MPIAGIAGRGGSARWIKRAVEDSLRRPGTDYIDLHQMHRPDYRTDIAETLSALSDLVREGKVRTIGSSTSWTVSASPSTLNLRKVVEVTGDEATLDRTHEIVEPGTDINPADNYDAVIPAMADKRLRRRH